jgi:hypothetical protein
MGFSLVHGATDFARLYLSFSFYDSAGRCAHSGPPREIEEAARTEAP